MKRRFVGAATGFLFGIFCGFISLLSAGGGHGSYMWIYLFVIPELCGIYFAVMGFLGADLSNSVFRWIFGILLFVNTIISSVIIWGNLTNDPYTIKAWNSDPLVATFITAVHIVPTLILATMLVLSVVLAEPDDNAETQQSYRDGQIHTPKLRS